MIETHNLTKRFSSRLVLQSIDLGVGSGEIVALLGPNGAGKSTLLRILATLTKPTSGLVRVAGFDVLGAAKDARANLGFVGHEPVLYEDLSAEQNLSFFARLYAVEKADRRIHELLATFDLEPRRKDPIRIFSRGMQQRLALARAVLHRPRVLLLDEPHSGLDREAVAIIDTMLRRLAKDGVAILLATHDLHRAQRLAQRIDVLAGGRMIESLGRKAFNSPRFPEKYDRLVRSVP